MNEKEFVIWLKGFADGIGDDITPKSWKILLNVLNTIKRDNGKTLLYDGMVNVIQDKKK